MTPETSKTEDFVTIGNAFLKIETEDCIKVLHECFPLSK